MEMKTKNFFAFAVLLLTATMTLSSCNEDEPKTTKIYGKITIENSDVWALFKDKGQVQVTVFPAFSLNPAAGWGEVPDNFFGPGVLGGTFAIGAPYNSQNPVILTYVPGQKEYEYEIELEAGTYSAVAVGFRKDDVTNQSCKTATLGVHHNKPETVSHGVVIKVNAGGTAIKVMDYPAPATFSIKAEEQKEINFKADFAFVNIWYPACR
jgi:hypothetical protein